MDAKYRQALDEMLKLDTLNEWERKAFSDIVERDEKFNITLSIKQKAMVEKARDKHILGNTSQERGLSLPEVYARCRLVMRDHGTLIEIDGVVIEKTITRKEGQVILAWLDGVEEEVAHAVGSEVSEASEAIAEAKKADSEEEPPF